MGGFKGTITNVVRDPSKAGGGMAAVAVPLHLALLERGVDARLICGQPPDEPVPSILLGSQNPLWGIGPPAPLVPVQSPPDIVHIHGIWTPFEWRVQRQARKRRARIIVSPHGALAPWALAHRRLKKWVAWNLYQRRSIQAADLIIASSRLEHSQLRHLGVASPIAIIPNGVNEPDSGFIEVAEAKRTKVILFLARLSPAKGVSDLLEAWLSVEDRRGYELHIHGFGEPSYRRFLERRIRQLGMGTHVKLLGPIYGREKWQKLRSCSAYVLPSYTESFGITVVEALLSGLPVITTTSTPWSCISGERLGWVVENDIGQLGQALQAALTLTQSELCAMARRARDYALRNFAWSVIADQYMQTYNWISSPSLPKPEWISIAQ